MQDDDQLRWRNLLQWLAGHGMKIHQDSLLVERREVEGAGHGLFALEACPSSTPLFTIPANALMNIQTLSSHYPSSSLSATQLISLHLCLHRPMQGQNSSDPLFGPYISILPREFEFHPLTWIVTNTGPDLQILPPSTGRALRALKGKFYEDLKAICQFAQGYPEALHKASRREFSVDKFRIDNASMISDYLWAWLNVNTRCVYRRVKKASSDPDNMTLCPILDFANHTTHLPHMLPSLACKGRQTARSSFGPDLTLLSPSLYTEPGKELYLTYGSHCNRTLFVEYGFVLTGVPKEAYVAEVEVDDIVECLFEERNQIGAWIKETLDSANYWKDWTLHASESAYPSYRLITALRLYSMCASVPFPPSKNMLQQWHDVTNGIQNEITVENEKAWREVLHHICTSVIDRATRALEQLPHSEHAANISTLWEEERYVAQCVADKIMEGEQF